MLHGKIYDVLRQYLGIHMWWKYILMIKQSIKLGDSKFWTEEQQMVRFQLNSHCVVMCNTKMVRIVKIKVPFWTFNKVYLRLEYECAELLRITINFPRSTCCKSIAKLIKNFAKRFRYAWEFIRTVDYSNPRHCHLLGNVWQNSFSAFLRVSSK